MINPKSKIKTPRLNPRFYCSPDEFSFKDFLAVIFTAGFFYACFRALSETQALELVQSIAYLMAVILGGYFGQEITAAVVKERYRSQRALMNYSNGGETGDECDDTDNPDPGNQSPV